MTLDGYLEFSMSEEAAARDYLRSTDVEVIEALEAVMGELVSVQNFAQLRKSISDQRERLMPLLTDRERARAILKGGD